MKQPNFLCPKEMDFLKSFEKCEKCKEKDNCINYKYEKEFIQRLEVSN